jgi:hypothetical protein
MAALLHPYIHPSMQISLRAPQFEWVLWAQTDYTTLPALATTADSSS